MTINVLVVDDSAFMRMMITKLLEADSDIHVIATARNGIDAIARTHQYHPHVITMDIEMPELDGISALKRIMQEYPTPIIMLSARTQKGAIDTVEALQCGAFDFLAKPANQRDIATLGESLIARVKLAAKAPLHALSISESSSSPRPVRVLSGHKDAHRISQIVAIGTSTGGPRALDTVLKNIPHNINAPIVVVQHMPPKFTKSLAERLNGLSEIRVVEGEEGQVLENGTAYIAPGGRHMTVIQQDGEYLISLNDNPKRNEHRPSVDVLFESVSALSGLKRHLVIMTGMGSDGARGMNMAKQAGATTIAESQETCVVFGMPKSAIELGCVDYVVPVHEIAQQIVECTHSHESR